MAHVYAAKLSCRVEERYSALTRIGGWVYPGSRARPRFTCGTWLEEIKLSGRAQSAFLR